MNASKRMVTLLLSIALGMMASNDIYGADNNGKLGVVNADPYIIVREEPAADSKEVARLGNYVVVYTYDMIDDEWIRITSGDVEGFVKRKRILTGKKAKRIAAEVETLRSEEVVQIGDRFYEEVLYGDESDYGAAVYEAAPVEEAVHDETVYEETAHEETAFEAPVPEETVGAAAMKDEQVYEQTPYDEPQYDTSAGEEPSYEEPFYQEPSYENLMNDTFVYEEIIYDEPLQEEAVYEEQALQKDTELGQNVAALAQEYLGTPYVWGGNDLKNGADCSGFTQSVFANYGIQIPRVAEDQYTLGQKVDVDSLQPGNLVFYDQEGEGIDHVAMYIGNGQVIHASDETTGVIISSLTYSGAPVGAVDYTTPLP